MKTQITFVVVLLQAGLLLSEQTEKEKESGGRKRGGKYLNWFEPWPYQPETNLPQVRDMTYKQKVYKSYPASVVPTGDIFGGFVSNGAVTKQGYPIHAVHSPFHSRPIHNLGHTYNLQPNPYLPYSFGVPIINSPNYIDNIPDIFFPGQPPPSQIPSLWNPVQIPNYPNNLASGFFNSPQPAAIVSKPSVSGAISSGEDDKTKVPSSESPEAAGAVGVTENISSTSSTQFTVSSFETSTVKVVTEATKDELIDPDLLKVDSETHLVTIEVPIRCATKEKLKTGLSAFLRDLGEQIKIIFIEHNCGSGFSSITGTLKAMLRMKEKKPEEVFLQVKASCYFGCEIANETFYFTDFYFSDSKEVKELMALPENMSCGTRRNDVARIVNGENARDGQYPWMAAVFVHFFDSVNDKYVFYYCGGSVISSVHILTAAHCLTEVQDPANVFVHVGDVELPFNNVTILIDEVLESLGDKAGGERRQVGETDKSSLESMQRILKMLGNPELSRQPQLLFFLEDILKGTTGRNRQGRKEGKSLREKSELIQNTIREKFPDMIFAENAVVHQQFNSDDERAENDIAIIKLEKPLKFNDAVRPICLPPPNLKPDGRAGVITGWGRTAKADGDSHLQVAGLPIWQLNECQEKYPPSNINVTENNICAGGRNKVIAACRGDSGGPLLHQLRDGRWTVAGVVSFAQTETCDEFSPTVFSRVSSYVEWIKESVEVTLIT